MSASTLKRPAQNLLDRFDVKQIGDDTVGTYLVKGWSLAICCTRCPRVVEWTPPILEAGFGDRPELKIAAIASRLTCTGEDGCGSEEVAVFPHPFEGVWTWRPGEGGGDL